MDGKRRFLQKAMSAGIEHGTMTPDDVLAHVTAEVLANYLPKAQCAKLLTASLAAKAMNAELIVDTLGIDVVAEYMPTHILWSCVSDAAERALGDEASDEPSKSASKSASKQKSGAAPTKAKDKDDAKGTGKGKAPAAKPNVAKKAPGPPSPPRAGAFGRAGSSPGARPRTRTPASEFDVDTDVGEDWPTNDPLAEAESLGASPEVVIEEHDLGDWPGEETRNVDVSTGPKR